MTKGQQVGMTKRGCDRVVMYVQPHGPAGRAHVTTALVTPQPTIWLSGETHLGAGLPFTPRDGEIRVASG